MFKKVIVTTLLAISLVLPTSIYADSAADEAQIAASKLMPTEDYNIVMKVNNQTGVEEYTYYNRYTGKAEKYELLDGEVISKKITRETFHPYSLLYKEDSNIVYPDIEDVYFSYVTLPDEVDYIYQMYTGKYSANNCVPSSIAMIYNWAYGLKGNKQATAQWIRDAFPSDSGEIGSSDYTLGYTQEQKKSIYRELGLNFKESGYITTTNPFLKNDFWLGMDHGFIRLMGT